MSTGNPGDWPNPKPLPAATVQAATPVIQAGPVAVEKTWGDRAWDLAKVLVPSMVFVLTALLLKSGKITQEDADFINKSATILVSSTDPSATVDITPSTSGKTSTVTVTPKTPVKKVDDEPTPADTISADVLKKIVDRIQALEDGQGNLSTAIQKLMNPPAPKPDPAVDPAPAPLPVDPSKPTIVVTDSAGKVVTDSGPNSKAATIDAGRPVKVVSTTAVEWLEDASNVADVDLLEFPGGYSCTLRNGASVTLTAGYTGANGKTLLAKVKLLCAAQPPPKPTPTPIDPDVKPTPKPVGEMKVVVIYESEQNHTRQQDLILASVVSGKINDVLTAKCSKGPDGRPNFRRWDQNLEVNKTSPMGSLFSSTLAAAQSKGLPAVVVSCGDDQTIYPIPPDATEDQVISIITCGAQ